MLSEEIKKHNFNEMMKICRMLNEFIDLMNIDTEMAVNAMLQLSCAISSFCNVDKENFLEACSEQWDLSLKLQKDYRKFKKEL